MITEADNEATVGKEVVRVVARLKIDGLPAAGWKCRCDWLTPASFRPA